jgi:large subunit ribosomal protein L5
MKPRLQQKYAEEIRPALQEKRGYQNIHEIPALEKVVIHMGVPSSQEKSALEEAMRDLATITGQRPVIDKARKSVSNFKIRAGQSIGCHVTLRRQMMYEFMDRLISATLPRIRDFRGLSSRGFDGQGNYSLGLEDQSIFPEIDLDKIKRHQGMDVTIVTTARTNEEAYDLLKLMGMPFAEKK